MEGQTLQCELGSEDHGRQTEVFREAQTSFNRYQYLKEQSVLSSYAAFVVAAVVKPAVCHRWCLMHR